MNHFRNRVLANIFDENFANQIRVPDMILIKKTAVIGAGTMGAQIAAHLANVGIPVLLLDVAPTELLPEETKRGWSLQHKSVRNRITQGLFDRMRKLSPAPFFHPDSAGLIEIGNVEDDLGRIAEADWVVEAVLERMDLKRDLHARIAALARPDAVVTTNTSGLSIHGMSEGLPEAYRKRFFATHFFNPPRYMRLLELIPNPSTDLAQMKEFASFAEATLGKGIVVGKDTPGFVANRIGCYDMQKALWLMLDMDLGIDAVDAVLGPAVGRPKSAMFRLGDIVGIDLMAQMGKNLQGLLKDPEELRLFNQPSFIEEMVKRGWWGQKKGQGFYQRIKTDKGREILTLDHRTLDYRPRQKFSMASLDAAKAQPDTAERIRALCSGSDVAAKFAWAHLSSVLCYSASRIPEIADHPATVDAAMRWGYNWELGPFETWDALGVRETARRLEQEGRAVPPLVQAMLTSGRESFHERRGLKLYSFAPATSAMVENVESPKAVSLIRLRQAGKVVKSNAGASLIDLGDGVACLEFHVKMNVIGGDQLGMLREALEEVDRQFCGLVIGNQGPHFSAGANLMMLTAQIQNQEWEDIDFGIRQFQKATSSLRTFHKPIVAACHGYTLGGGCELSLGCHHVVAAAETYMGLPEAGVGLIPAAHGSK
ncbi:MAG: 3-hydroxyacyl-CoA dehydrogenase, partial [Verrucomicrobia bacterium]|nr:3-hydroxyacyl-CoA dehydrogenase [Verrucomicrobiota bacterium]